MATTITQEQQLANNKQQIVYITERIMELSTSIVPCMEKPMKTAIKKQIAQHKRMLTSHVNAIVKLEYTLANKETV